MQYGTHIDSRALGQYPLSIATSLAIESACGIHPEIEVDSPPILKYKSLWVNVKTLFRNLMGSLSKDAAAAVTDKELAEVLKEEMETIEHVISEVSQNSVRVIFYVSDYASLEQKYRHAVIRMDSTPRQKIYTALMIHTLTLLFKLTEPGKIKTFSNKLKAEGKLGALALEMASEKTLILTHYAYDLLSYKNFSGLTLLESHTGAIKDKSMWYTKYYNGKDLSMIPFREDFIQIFGDNETFRTFDPAVRHEIVEIAKKYKWSSVTTYDRLRLGIDSMKNPYARKIILDMMSSAY